MKNLMIIIAVAAAVCFSVFGMKSIIEENKKTQAEVYMLLEKDELTPEEKEFIEFVTDDREMKETTINLDEKHRDRFMYHFGYNR